MNENKTNVLIRADANSDIGMGHIMRCLSIADSFTSVGESVIFILADNMVDNLIKSRGYNTVILNSDYRTMDEEQWPDIIADYILVDSYFVTYKYLCSLKHRAKTLAYIDDLNAFPYPVDVVINYNVYGFFLNYKSSYDKDNAPLFILGATFAPLRAMFRDVERKKQNKIVRNILISTGGSDIAHIALKLVQSKPINYTFHLLLGNMNPDKDVIINLSEENKNFVIHENVIDMRSFISEMDIAVSAAGSTLYEICACGVPLITYSIADNQIYGAEAFEKLELAINIGDLRNIPDPCEKIIGSVKDLANNYEKRVHIGNKMQDMIDGYGADRIVETILK